MAPATKEPAAIPETTSPWARMGPLTIEFGTARNGYVGHGLTLASLRGAWRMENLLPDEAHSIESDPGTAPGLPKYIPGMRQRIDFQRRTVRTWDPLGDPEFASVLEGIIRARRRGRGGLFINEVVGPCKETILQDLNDTGLKSHLFWCFRHVSDKLAVVIEGRLPDLREIECLPGRTRINVTDNRPHAIRYREDRPHHLVSADEYVPGAAPASAPHMGSEARFKAPGGSYNPVEGR
jgi:hypothetical protein